MLCHRRPPPKKLLICVPYVTKFNIMIINDVLVYKKNFGYFSNVYILSIFPLALLKLDGKDIEWVVSWPYLGVTIKSHVTFNCCIDKKVKSFYRSANGILRIEGRSNETVMLQLLESHCLPILTYAIEAIHIVSRDERRRLRVAYNSIFRKVFNYRTWESVTDLQHALQRPTWEELVDDRRQRFSQRIALCQITNTLPVP